MSDTIVSQELDVLLTGYFSHLTPLIIEASQDATRWKFVWNFLERSIKEHANTPSIQFFLRAETLFYQGDYLAALELYQQCPSTSWHNFFVERTEGFIADQKKDTTNAIAHLERALEFNTDDYTTIQKLYQLHQATSQEEKTEYYSLKLEQIEDQTQGSIQSELKINLDQEEKAELSKIFAFPQPETSYDPLTSSAPRRHLKDLEETLSKVIGIPPSPSQATTSNLDLLGAFSSHFDDKSSQIDSFTKKSTSEFLRETLGMDLSLDSSLEMRIKAFKKRHARLMAQYVEQSSKRTHFDDHFMYVLHGWDYTQQSNKTATVSSVEGTILEEGKGTSGGYYLRWNGKGIVINPGSHFLKYFHQQDLFIKDIDYVIVTRSEPEYYANVKPIYDLNYEHNTLSKDLHIISYYLNETAFEVLSTQLKPRFKQEKNTVQSLDVYLDSPELETIQLDDVISLDYFHNLKTESSGSEEQKNIGVCLRLKKGNSLDKTQEHDYLSLSYVSGLSWDNSMAQHLKDSDVIIAGFEQTQANDYNKLEFNKTSLGYFGSYQLIDSINPQIFIFTEFKGQEGDIRLEVAKKLRQEFAYKQDHQTVILPGDVGMYLELKTLRVRCSISRSFVIPSESRVMKPLDSWGNLQYLSPTCFV